MTGPVPPGQGGLPGRLAELEKRIEELSRRSHRNPVCVVPLADDVATTARTDFVLGPSLSPTPEVDTDGMYVYNPTSSFDTDNPTHLRIPVQGRYLIVFHQRWAYYPPSSPFNPAVLSAKILRNSKVVSGHSIGSSAVQAAQFGEGTTVDAITMWPRLDVGDKIYFNVYSQFTWTVLASDVNGNRTWIGAYYLGSD